jgi:hypothetical protein
LEISALALNFSTARLRWSTSGRSVVGAERGGERSVVGDGDVAEEEGVAIRTRAAGVVVDGGLEELVAVASDEQRTFDVVGMVLGRVKARRRVLASGKFRFLTNSYFHAFFR